MDWQSISAGAIVIITLLVFTIRLIFKSRGKNCGGNCGCAKKSSKSV
jgi:hypothetical protein